VTDRLSRGAHPPAAASWALLITVLAAFGVAGYLGVRRVVASRQRLQLPDGGFSRETTVTAKILMNFLQTVSFLGDFELQWTPEVSCEEVSRARLRGASLGERCGSRGTPQALSGSLPLAAC